MAKKPVIVPKVSNTEDLPIADASAPEPVLPRKPKEEKPKAAEERRAESGERKKPAGERPALLEVPAMVEFLPMGAAETWRVDKCDLLATEFGLGEPSFVAATAEGRPSFVAATTEGRPSFATTAEGRPSFAATTEGRPSFATTAEGRPPVALAVLERRVAEFVFFCQSHPRLWLLVRRLYGIAPVIPAADAHPGDLRIWTRAELEAEGFEVKTDLEALRGFWVNHCKREGRDQRSEVRGRRWEVGEQVGDQKRAGSETGAPGGELELNDQLLDELDFSERMFCITVYDPLARITADGKGGNVPRPEQENRKEREWFLGRVREWEKMLRDSIGGALARSALMNELHLRRMEAEIAVAEPKSRGALYDQQATQTKEYRESVEKLQKMFPELAVAGKVSFKATISDVIRSYLDYYGSADRRLVDKVRTVMEMEYELRTSAQVESRYRFGLNLAIIDNINGLTDPNFMPRFKPRVLKVATEGFRAGVEAARAASREKVVDLEHGVLPGEGDDFEDYNDAECPHCGGGVSSQATRCPECRRQINPSFAKATEGGREVVVPPASPIPPASPVPAASPIPPASPAPPPAVHPVHPAEQHGHYVPVEDQFYGHFGTADRLNKMTPRRDFEQDK